MPTPTPRGQECTSKKIVIVGSYNVHLRSIIDLSHKLTERGHDVLHPSPSAQKTGESNGFVRLSTDESTDEGVQQRRVFSFIDEADAVFVYATGSVGTSTALEIGYTIARGTPICLVGYVEDITINKLLARTLRLG